MKKTLSLILIVAIASFFYPDKVYAAAPTDYVSCWDLDEASSTRVDANTTNSNDLTDNNTVLSATGVVGNGADFELTNSEYLNITDANQVGLDITGDLSFSTWYKPESAPATNDAHALMYKWASGNASYGFVFGDNAGTKYMMLLLYESSSPANSVNYTWTGRNATTSTLTHIVVRFDLVGHASGAGTAELFINSASQGTVTDGTISDINNGTGAFSLSSLSSGIQWYSDGVMDVSEIYNRLLTNAEITSLYNSGAGVACPPASRTGGGGGTTPVFGDIIWFN